MKLAVIQHSPWEGPGRYLLQEAAANKVELFIIKAWEAIFPDPDNFAGFILLGGGINVDEEDKYPFLIAEKKYIQTIIATDKPCLGICLGHQLLAESLGATVGPNFCYSIGIGKALLTTSGRRHPMFAGINNNYQTFKWHGQAVLPPVPKQFEILATSTECQVEAFSVKDHPHIIGVQYDNHAAHPNDVAHWYEQDRTWLDSIDTFFTSQEEMQKDIKEVKNDIENDFKKFFSSFCKF